MIEAVGDPDRPVPADLLIRFSRCIGPTVIETLLDSAPRLIDEASEAAVLDCLVAVAEDDPRHLARYVAGAYGDAGRMMIRALTAIGRPQCGPVLGRLLRCGDTDIRTQAVLALDVIDHPRKQQWLASVLDDPAIAVRMSAYDALAGLPGGHGRQPLLRATEADDLAHRPGPEIEALFGALARVGDADVVEALESRLRSQTGFFERALSKLTDKNSNALELAMVRCLETMAIPEATEALSRLVTR